MATTYQTIVAALRERIETGELRPGERVPSTRALTREWGVAIATATKALANLQAEGLVRGVVGVGTVVTDRPQSSTGRARPSPERELSRERIVGTAITIADAEGLAALTMRRLATELDVAVMSLYRHVSGKDDLVAQMADQVMGEIQPLTEPPASWQEQLARVLRSEWEVCKRHPWLPATMSLVRPPLIPNGMAHTESIMRVARALGFDAPSSLYVAVALAGFLVGIGSSLHLEAEAQRETGLTSDEYMETQGEAFTDIARDRFPVLFEAAATPGFDMRLDDVFEFGLGLLLDGLARRVPAPQKRVRSLRSTPRSAS